MSNAWKYVGKGERISYGVPTRDLSADEFKRLNPLDQRHVMKSDLYREVKAANTPKTDGKEAK